MTMHKIVTALLAGAAVGVFATVLHFAFVQNLIVTAELYESGARQHFAGVTATGADHAHAPGEAAHSHGEDGAGAPPDSLFLRSAMTAVFTIFFWGGFALLLYGAMQVAAHFGQKVDARSGILWGLAGFACFTLAPTLGLPPELPGSVGADLGDRQVWWGGTAVATGLALALLAFGRMPWLLLALPVAALPFVIGAPHPEAYGGVAPPEVAASFAARTIGTAFLSWALLGWLLGRVEEREG